MTFNPLENEVDLLAIRFACYSFRILDWRYVARLLVPPARPLSWSEAYLLNPQGPFYCASDEGKSITISPRFIPLWAFAKPKGQASLVVQASGEVGALRAILVEPRRRLTLDRPQVAAKP